MVVKFRSEDLMQAARMDIVNRQVRHSLVLVFFLITSTEIQITQRYRSHRDTGHIVIQITQRYRSHRDTDHTAGQITQRYRSHSSTDHTAVQITQRDRSHSGTDHTAVQITQLYRSHSSTDHTAVQITQPYRSHSHTDHTAIQITQPYRSHSHTDHTAVQITQPYRSHSRTDHTAVQITQPYRSHSRTDHTAVQITQPYRSYSRTDHTAVQITQPYRSYSGTDHTAVQITQPYRSHSAFETRKPTLVRLSDHLMGGYKKDVRPVLDWKKTTTVYIDVMVYAILGVDEKNQVLTTYIWYRQFWVDEFLTWDPAKFENVTQISIPTGNIWVPDILINEFVDVGKSPDIPYVYVNHEGRVQNYKPIQVVTACSLNIYNFPFDVQNCSLTFTSWLHTIQDINVSLWRTPEEVKEDKSLFMNKGEWELLYVLSQYRTFVENEDSFAEMKFHVVIKRRPLFYAVNLLLPSMFLMVMDIIGFYLPPDSGERVSFKITLLLGYSVFLIIVSDTLPATAIGTPLIGKFKPSTLHIIPFIRALRRHVCVCCELGCTGVYFVVCMALLVISLTETILIVRLVHKQDLQPHVPEWVKRLVLEKITALLCIRDKNRFSAEVCQQMESNSTAKLAHYNSENSKNYERSSGAIVPPKESAVIVDSILHEIASIRHYLEKRDEHRDIAKEWLQVGYVLDVLLFRVYLVAVLAYTVTMATLWSYWQQV
ncbi:5-hydroxytryptamine receptor 3A-like [Bombina bombina]|uniref:5-hydroxytryptamine receptor 3A-like n=1 Tax=Bombina bombina TaxID=8345 RepID=UPI00235AB3F4|nr:5-hydroxytryptamine receptor 3A-like [Bombina bombina]